MKFGKRRFEEKFYRLENNIQKLICLYPIQILGDHPIYHICASLHSLCDGKEGEKTIN
jgi:hypothetical protein